MNSFEIINQLKAWFYYVPHHSHEKHFQPINTHLRKAIDDYTITLIKEKNIISLLRIRCSLFVKIKVPSIYGCFASSLVGFEGEDFNKLLNLVNEFSLFRYYLAFEKSLTLHLSKFQSPSLKLVCTVALEKKMCKFCQYIFAFSLLFDHGKVLTLHLNN